MTTPTVEFDEPSSPAPRPAGAAPVVPAPDPSTQLLTRKAVQDVSALPSQFKPYPAGVKITYRVYNLEELDYFEQSKVTNLEYYELILRGVEVTGMHPDDLTFADVRYLGLLRRLLTMGDSNVGIASSCKHCEHVNRGELPTSELAFDDLNVPALPITAQFSTGPLTFSPFTLKDYRQLSVLQKEMHGHSILAVQIRNIPYPNSLELVTKLTDPTDIALIKKVDELLYHGVSDHPVTCAGCGKSYMVDLEDGLDAFIYPFRRAADDLEAKISFG